MKVSIIISGVAKSFYLMTCLLLSTSVYGQSGGSASSSLIGSVQDTEDAVISGATVKLYNKKTNLIRETITSDNGSYTISQLPPGEYEVAVSIDGFSNKLGQATLTVGNITILNFILTVGTIKDDVIVEAGGLNIEGRTERATNIDNESINNLPINRRDFLSFTLITAGVAPDRVSATGASRSSGLSFNGQSARNNNVTIDGVDNNNTGNGSVRSTFSQDAVQEFQVIVADSSAEFGRALGGVVNIVTKGGSNELHGTVFNFIRNDDISARDAFSSFKPEFKQYQFGATLGGPIKKDKAFFFLSFERLSLKQNNVVTIKDSIVSAAQRLGLPASNGPVPFGEAFSGFLQRLDFQLSSNDRLNIRYSYGGNTNGQLQMFGGLKDGAAAGALNLNDNTIATSNTYVNTRFNLTNETRFLFSRLESIVSPADPKGPQVNIFSSDGQIILGRDPLLPQTAETKFYELVNNLSLNKGQHQIKVGFDFLFTRIGNKKVSIPVAFGGIATFGPLNFSQLTGIPGLPALSSEQAFDPNLRTVAQRAFLTILSNSLPQAIPGFPQGLPLADLSLPTSFLQGFGDPRGSVGYNYYSAYAQDDFRLRPNLLIKVGLRYDQERIRFTPTNKGRFNPRFAFFYTPSKLERLSIFGSYGIYQGTTQYAAPLSAQFLDGKTVVIPTLVFPFSIIPFSLPGHRFPDSPTIPTQVPFIPQLTRTITISPTLKTGYAHEVNTGINYLISDKAGLTLSYQYVRGLNVFLTRDINPVVRPIPGDPLNSLIRGRIDPTKGQVQAFESSGDSYYSAGTISFFVKFPKRFSLLAHYTVSKTIDNYIDALRTDILELQNPLNLRAERGLSLQDLRGRFVFSSTFNTGNSGNWLLRNFDLSSIITLNSGQPFNLLVGADLDGNGDVALPADRPNGIARNSGRLPGFASVDFRISRSIFINDQIKITAYAEVFNLANRTNISDVSRIFPINSNGTFNLPRQEAGRFIATPDRFTAAFRPRQFQLGFRLAF
ncbi:MAG: TonB-dependent receptor [Acidobacteria bacterium]|nr:TonB-dependent receptor [Acidobacteriota bacterium]